MLNSPSSPIGHLPLCWNSIAYTLDEPFWCLFFVVVALNKLEFCEPVCNFYLITE